MLKWGLIEPAYCRPAKPLGPPREKFEFCEPCPFENAILYLARPAVSGPYCCRRTFPRSLTVAVYFSLSNYLAETTAYCFERFNFVVWLAASPREGRPSAKRKPIAGVIDMFHRQDPRAGGPRGGGAFPRGAQKPRPPGDAAQGKIKGA